MLDPALTPRSEMAVSPHSLAISNASAIARDCYNTFENKGKIKE